MSRRGGRGSAQQSAPSWADVDAFLEMATKALNARTKAAQELEAKLALTSLRLAKEIQEKGQASAFFESISRLSKFWFTACPSFRLVSLGAVPAGGA